MEIQPFVVAPDVIRCLSQQLQKMGEASFLAEPQIIDGGQLVEVQEFIVDSDFLRIIFGGKDTGYMASDTDGSRIF